VNLNSPQDFSQYAEQTETKKKKNGNDAVTIGDIETVKNEEISAPHKDNNLESERVGLVLSSQHKASQPS